MAECHALYPQWHGALCPRVPRHPSHSPCPDS
jgi:hypothetical protein